MNSAPSIDGMTDEQIIRAIAMEVMWWVPEYAFGNGESPAHYSKEDRSIVVDWNPLIDWNATMQIVERMQEKGWAFYLNTCFWFEEGEDDNRPRACFFRP